MEAVAVSAMLVSTPASSALLDHKFVYLVTNHRVTFSFMDQIVWTSAQLVSMSMRLI